MGTFVWRLSLLVAAIIVIGCQGQTFQYSRGWTNGKRAGSYAAPAAVPLPSTNNGGSPSQVLEVDNGVASLEEPSAPAGTFRMIPSSDSYRFRDRDSRDYFQLGRKLGSVVNSSNNRKPAYWILGVDQENVAEF